ncbi:hypothetical protein AAMO2058_001423300 [Amorphochlora amoebiformis]|uniref:UEV domain-containing protein n=1 Tax=Amorphochlora amoebiformis TaxID=1561963 RepID=A0A7S0GS26_9EUKA
MSNLPEWETKLGTCGYSNQGRVLADVRELLAQTRSLSAKVEPYVFNTGRTANLLSLAGTIPIHFKRKQYNIPVRLLVSTDYPNNPPIGYVTPTKAMRIHRGHPNVDESGVIYMTYPIWIKGQSNLSMVCFELMQKFSIRPPVYAAGTGVRVNRVVRPGAAGQYGNQFRKPHPAQRPVVRPDVKQTPVAQPIAQPRHPHAYLYPKTNPYIDAKAQEKDRLLKKARELLTEGAHERLATQKEEIDRLLACESKLKQGKLYLVQSKAGMFSEKKQLEETTANMKKKIEEVTQWIAENKDKKLDVDTALGGKDTWSKQILQEVAKDHAIGDTLYALDKALEDGRVSLDVFLRQVRRLAKQQFRHRVLALKIMERQQQRSAMEM